MMENIMRLANKIIVPIMLMTPISSALASRPGTIITRCTGPDMLKVKSEAIGRLEWAKKCKLITRKMFNDAAYSFDLQPDGSSIATPLDLPYYPTFGDGNESDWPSRPASGYGDPAKNEAPINESAPCPAGNNAQFQVIGWCETAGCYRYDQKVLFNGEEVAIAQAQEENLRHVSTLSSEATLDNLSYDLSEVDYYTSSRTESIEHMRKFKTESGRQLTVTVDHPLVDKNGYIRTAEKFSVGDHLILENGERDQIKSIEDYEMLGKVYNLAPKQRGARGTFGNLSTQVIVSQGFLNGSVRFQNGYKDFLDRMVVRTSINESVFQQ